MQKQQKEIGIPTAGVPLHVGQCAPNSFGLYDTIGNVEEWVNDWHGPYPTAAQSDPVGPQEGVFRGTRGGSHSTELYYLRTANRAGALPEERSWYIGFRVAAHGAIARGRHEIRKAQSIPGDVPNMVFVKTEEDFDAPDDARPRKMQSSNATWPQWSSDPMSPVVRRYVNWPGNGSQLPFAVHNHEPTIVACPDGSMYASWYSTNCGEPGRCVGLVDARLAPGAASWTVAQARYCGAPHFATPP